MRLSGNARSTLRARLLTAQLGEAGCLPTSALTTTPVSRTPTCSVTRKARSLRHSWSAPWPWARASPRAHRQRQLLPVEGLCKEPLAALFQALPGPTRRASRTRPNQAGAAERRTRQAFMVFVATIGLLVGIQSLPELVRTMHSEAKMAHEVLEEEAVGGGSPTPSTPPTPIPIESEPIEKGEPPGK